MTNLTRVRVHLLLLAVVAVLTTAVRSALWHHHNRDLAEIAQRAADQGSLKVEAVWKGYHYTQAGKPGFADDFLARIDWRQLEISELQATRLRARLKELISYLQSPTFDQYYRLKTDGLHYQFKPADNAQRLLASSWLTGRFGPPDEPREVVELLWTSTYRDARESNAPRITAVCLDQIAAAVSSTNTPHSLLRGKVRKGFTKAAEAINPGFIYSMAGGDPPASNREGPFLHLSFFAKANGSDSAGPVYISLCWLPEDQAWGLSRMIADSWSGVQTSFF